MKTRETLSLLDLPWDLEVEILSRVPATSLRRLRFTCKRWNALFKDRDFIKKHLDKAANQGMVLLLSDLKVYSMKVEHGGVHDNVVEPQTLMNLNNFHNISQRVKICKIFHCNGFLLCTTSDLRLVVWNPCTDQVRWIPYNGRYKHNSEFVLGCENNKSCQTYKILRYSWDSHALNRRVVECGIYDFGSHSWRNLNDAVPKTCTITSQGVSLKGNTYWIANTKYEVHLLSFDFSTERFRRIYIHSPGFGDNDYVPRALSVVREEGMCVLYSNFFGTLANNEIWMTTDNKIGQTKKLSWSKFLSVEADENKRFPNGTTFFIDDKKKVAVLCDLEYRHFWNRDVVYIVGEDNRFMKIPVGKSRLGSLRPLIYNYVPSLVRIQQGGVMTRAQKKRMALVVINNHVISCISMFFYSIASFLGPYPRYARINNLYFYFSVIL